MPILKILRKESSPHINQVLKAIIAAERDEGLNKRLLRQIREARDIALVHRLESWSDGQVKISGV